MRACRAGRPQGLSVLSPKALTASTIPLACSEEAVRGEGARMTPMKLAPERHARRASSTLVTPQTLTQGAAALADMDEAPCDAPPRRDAMRVAGLGCRIKASPTNTARTPSAAYWATSCGPVMPLRAATTTPSSGQPCSARGADCGGGSTWRRPAALNRPVRREVVPRSSWNVCRSRLLTPITLAPDARATSSSRSLATSTRGSMPQPRLAARRSASSWGFKMATMRSTLSAPCARASANW